jgi:hypothetical protein
MPARLLFSSAVSTRCSSSGAPPGGRGRGARRVVPLELGDVRVVAVLEQRDQQLLLRAEVVQNPGMGHPDPVGDVVQRAVRVPAFTEDRHRCLEDLGPPATGPLLRSLRPAGP